MLVCECLLGDKGKDDWDNIRLPPQTHIHHDFQKNSAPSRRLRQRMDLPFCRTFACIALSGHGTNALTISTLLDPRIS